MATLDFALAILRIGVGLTFAAHGAQKAFGWWGGPGQAGWVGAMTKMGFEPPGLFAVLSIGIELVGGVCLALGLLSPIAAAVLVAQSIVIVVRAHWANGFFTTKGGIEFPLALGIGATAIGLAGPAGLSLDAVIGLGFSDAARISLLVAGLVGGVIAQAIPDLEMAYWRHEMARTATRLHRG